MPKRETHEFFFRDDHDRLVRVEVDDFNDGKPPQVSATLCRYDSTFVTKLDTFPLESVPMPAHSGFIGGSYDAARERQKIQAKLCPLHAAWGDGETPSAIELCEEGKKLQRLLDDPQWGLFSWMGMLHERLRSLHRMITNILVKA